MNLHHAWRTFKITRAYAVLASLRDSPLAGVFALFAGIGVVALTLTIMWAINYYLVVNEYLPPPTRDGSGSAESNAAIYCALELIAMVILGLLCSGIYITVDETIAKLRIDLKKYDIEAAQYIDKRQS